MRSVPQWKMIIIGVLTTVNGIFILFASPNVPGVMQALLGPTIVTIPMAMLLSFIMLKRRYNFFQLFSVLVILAGLGVAIYPSVAVKGAAKQFGNIFWNSMFLLGSVPAAISSVYEEKAFEEQPIHIAYMLAYSTLWQMLSILASFPVDAIPHFGTATSFADIFIHQLDAFNCLAGKELAPGVCDDCDCSQAGFYVSMFVLFYVLSSFFTLGVVKYGNAAFSFIVGTISTPVQEFAYAWPLLMGSQVESLSNYNYISLAILVVGVLLYRVFDRKINSAETTADLLQKTHKNSGSSPLDEEEVDILKVGPSRGYLTMQPRLFVKKTRPSVEKEKLPSDSSYYWTV